MRTIKLVLECVFYELLKIGCVFCESLHKTVYLLLGCVSSESLALFLPRIELATTQSAPTYMRALFSGFTSQHNKQR
jgi:hypothetical protein